MTSRTRFSVRVVLIAAALGLAALAAAACGGGSPSENGGGAAEARDSSGGVEITLTRIVSPADLPEGSGALDPTRAVAFGVSMTAHSGDLTKYDMKQNAVLRAGAKEYPVAEWRFTKSDSHHPQALLVFDASPQQIGDSFEVVIRSLGSAPERVLRFGG